ncbi:MAG: low molecular weight phosphatase family protein [Pseudomonadota bacterium]
MCNHNAVRSPMAFALAKRFFRGRIFTDAAGLEAGQLDGFSVYVMGEIGSDIANYVPKDLEDVDAAAFQLIITLTPEAHHRALEFTRDADVGVEYWPTEDPTTYEGSRETRLTAYRQVRDTLAGRIKRRFAF